MHIIDKDKCILQVTYKDGSTMRSICRNVDASTFLSKLVHPADNQFIGLPGIVACISEIRSIEILNDPINYVEEDKDNS